MIEKVKEFLNGWEDIDNRNENCYFKYKYNKYRDEEVSFEDELDKLFGKNHFDKYKFINIGHFDTPSCYVSYNSLSIVEKNKLYVFPIIFID